MTKTVCVLAIVFWAELFAPNRAHCQIVDVVANIGDTLRAYGPVPITRTTQVARTVEHCTAGKMGEPNCTNVTVYDTKSQTTNDILAPSNIRVIAYKELKFDPITSTELPDKMLVKDSLTINCSSIPATQQISLQEAFQRNSSVTISQSVSHTLTVQINFGLTLAPGFTAGGSVSIGENDTTGQSKTEGSQSTVTQSVSGSMTVLPHSSAVAELQVWPVHYVAPFHTIVTIDADLSANDKGLHVLSQLSDESKRTFPVAGTVVADDASSGRLVVYDTAYDATQCGARKDIIYKTNFIPKEGAKLTERK